MKNIRRIIIYVFFSVFCYAEDSVNVSFKDESEVLKKIKSTTNLFCTPLANKGTYTTRITGFDPHSTTIFCGLVNTEETEGEEETSADKIKPLEEVNISDTASVKVGYLLKKYNTYPNRLFANEFMSEIKTVYALEKTHPNIVKAFQVVANNLQTLYVITPFGAFEHPNTQQDDKNKIFFQAMQEGTSIGALKKAFQNFIDLIMGRNEVQKAIAQKIGLETPPEVEETVNNVINNTFSILNQGFYHNIPNMITISQMLGGMATLNPDIIALKSSSDGIKDIDPASFFLPKKSNNQGLANDITLGGAEGVLTKGLYIYKGAASDGSSLMAKTAGSLESAKYFNFINLDNLNYYATFFQSIQIVYNFLTKFLLVLVGTYFGGLYMAKKGFNKFIEKQQGQVDVKSKLALIIIAGIFFFIPVNQENQITTTIYQNTWKRAVNFSTLIADRTNQLGFRAIINNSIGQIETPKIDNFTSDLNKLSLNILNNAILAYQIKKTCYDSKPYDIPSNYQIFNELEIKKIERVSTALKNNTDESIITFRACRTMELQLSQNQEALLDKLNAFAYSYAFAEQFYRDIETASNPNYIGGNMFFKVRSLVIQSADVVKQVGWVSSAIIPSLSVLISNNLMPDVKPQPTIEAKTKIKNLNHNQVMAVDKGSIPSTGIGPVASLYEGAEAIDGYVKQNLEFYLGKTIGLSAYMLIPGASAVMDFIMDIANSFDKAGQTIAKATGVGGIFYSAIGSLGVKGVGLIIGLFAVGVYINLFMEKLPLLIATVIGMFAVAFYFYELIIYTFVSPFVVLFAMTTGSQNMRIQRFLTTGLILILKPTLIVLSIYLAIYTFYTFQDIGSIIEETFYATQVTLTTGFLATASLFFMTNLLKIITCFGSILILYKTITGFPSLVFKLLGLQDVYDNENVLSEAMKTKSGQMSGFQ